MKETNQPFTPSLTLTSVDLIVLSFLFDRPTFGSLLMGKVIQDAQGVLPVPTVMKALKKLCEWQLVRGFPDPVPTGLVLKSFFSITGQGKEALLLALSDKCWDRHFALGHFWTRLATKLGYFQLRRMLRKRSSHVESLLRIPDSASGPFQGQRIS